MGGLEAFWRWGDERLEVPCSWGDNGLEDPRSWVMKE